MHPPCDNLTTAPWFNAMTHDNTPCDDMSPQSDLSPPTQCQPPLTSHPTRMSPPLYLSPPHQVHSIGGSTLTKNLDLWPNPVAMYSKMTCLHLASPNAVLLSFATNLSLHWFAPNNRQTITVLIQHYLKESWIIYIIGCWPWLEKSAARFTTEAKKTTQPLALMSICCERLNIYLFFSIYF